jgi:hypothetical protein
MIRQAMVRGLYLETRMELPLVVYVDVDDTLIRTVGAKKIPMVEVIEQVRALFANGAQLYCWSSGGGEYAESIAKELKIAHCFAGFLPKPHILLDDQASSEWRRMVHVHPAQCGEASAENYRKAIGARA